MKLDLQLPQPATFAILPNAEITWDGHVLSTTGRLIDVDSRFPAQPGLAVLIQWPENVLLAEVISLSQSSNTVTLKIRHALRTNDISVIRQKWL